MSADRLRVIRRADVADVRFALGAGHRGSLDGKMREKAEAALDRLSDLAEWAADAADFMEAAATQVPLPCGDLLASLADLVPDPPDDLKCAICGRVHDRAVQCKDAK